MSTSWLYDLARKPVEPREKKDFNRKNPLKRLFSRNLPESLSNDNVTNNSDTLKDPESPRTTSSLPQHSNTTILESSLPGQPAVAPEVPPPLSFSDSTVLLASLLLLLAVWLYRSRVQRKRHWESYGSNEFPPLAPLGTVPLFPACTGIDEMAGSLLRCAERVGPVFRLPRPFASGQSPMLVAVGDVDAAKELLLDAASTKPVSLSSFITELAGGSNIRSSDGVHWKLSRKAMNPAFLQTNLDRFHQTCRDQTESWIEHTLIPSIQSGQSFDVSQESLKLTLSIVCRAAFEYEIDDDEIQRVLHDLELVSQECHFQELYRPFSDIGKSLLKQKKLEEAKNRLQIFAGHVLHQYRKKQKKRRSTLAVTNSLISCIERNTNYENDTNRIADIVIMLVSATEATSYTLAWTLVELARNPREQVGLRKALQGTDDDLAHQMLKDVIRESMRLRPSSPGIGVRMASKDYYFKTSAMVIPKQSLIVFPSILLTRTNVDDPEIFRPSRWLEHSDRSFLSFSFGKRNCLGQTLALSQLTWVISRLCASFSFEEVPSDASQNTNVNTASPFQCRGIHLKARNM